MLNRDLLQELATSNCFGHAYDEKAKECDMCSLKLECAAKSKTNKVFDELLVLSPEVQKSLDSFRTSPKRRKRKLELVSGEPSEKSSDSETRKERRLRKKKELPPGFPDSKTTSIEELWKILEEKGGTCKEFSDPKIQKMRLIMALKKVF